MKFIKSIAQGQAASRNMTTGQIFLFWSLHDWKSNWRQNESRLHGLEGRLSAESPLFETCVIRSGA